MDAPKIIMFYDIKSKEIQCSKEYAEKLCRGDNMIYKCGEKPGKEDTSV